MLRSDNAQLREEQLTMANGDSTHASGASNYAQVNDLNMYYEIHGEGEPLVLLHGGVGASEMFGANLPEFAKTRQVIAVHLQGHGRTLDIDRPLRYESMADDIAALVEHLGFEKADLMGYSMGGGVALQTVIRHPEVVGKLVVVSEPIKRDGWYPEVLASFEQMAPNAAQIAEGMEQSPLNELYPGADWETLFTKMGDMESRDYDWTEEVAAITSPTMIVFADADAVRPETSSNSTNCLAAANATRASTARSGPPRGWRSCLGPRTTTSSLTLRWLPQSRRSSKRPCQRPKQAATIFRNLF
jgi:pimeloyl-ACP methyl ester carboxylesterase